MRTSKITKTAALAAALAFSAVPFAMAAETPSELKGQAFTLIEKMISAYLVRIAELETENAKLKEELAALKTSPSVAVPAVPAAPQASPSAAPSPATASGTPVATGNALYDSIVATVNADLPAILKENSLAADSQLGLFEFVEGAKAFFISIDDGKNPAGVTAFKTKILYTYDSKGVPTVAGVFDLDYAASRYRTLYGTNPYSKSSRFRVKNPDYKGKLLDEAVTVPSGGTASATVKPATTAAPAPAVTGEVTAREVRAAYDKNKVKDAVALADAYLAKNPDDVSILTVRYRSLYMLSRFSDALRDVQSIERIQGDKFDCTVAKDAAFIAKAAKNSELAAKYGAMCKR